MDQKTVLLLHNGILSSRKKEGTPTLCNSMDGTGKYAWCTKPVGKKQIPCDLTQEKSNEQNKLMSETKPEAWTNETDWQTTERRGEGIMVKRRGRD